MRFLNKILLILGVTYALLASINIVNAETTQEAEISPEKEAQLKEECDANDALACFAQGLVLLGREEFVEAVSLLGKSCDLGWAGSCAYLGLMSTKQPQLSAAYFKKCCDLGGDDGVTASITAICFYELGKLYLRQDWQQNYALGAEYMKKGCNLGNGTGCGALGGLYYFGLGVRQNYSLAAEYCKKGCDLADAFSCYVYGTQYVLGEGVRQSYDKAKEYFGKACDLGKQEGCDAYAKLNLISQ